MKTTSARAVRRMTSPGGWHKATREQTAADRRRASQLGVAELETQTSKEEDQGKKS